MSFPSDGSTQLNNYQTLITTFTTNTTPDININGTSGIYNPSANTIKIFANNTDALTIDSNQCLYGNGTGFTHLQYTNIDGKPSYFPADYNSTVINTPNLSGYATNTNLNNLSSQSFLTNYTNLNSLNVSGTTKLNGVTSCLSSLNVISDLKVYNGRANITNTNPYGSEPLSS